MIMVIYMFFVQKKQTLSSICPAMFAWRYKNKQPQAQHYFSVCRTVCSMISLHLSTLINACMLYNESTTVGSILSTYAKQKKTKKHLIFDTDHVHSNTTYKFHDPSIMKN